MHAACSDILTAQVSILRNYISTVPSTLIVLKTKSHIFNPSGFLLIFSLIRSQFQYLPRPPSPKVFEQLRINFTSRNKKGKLAIRSHCVQRQSINWQLRFRYICSCEYLVIVITCGSWKVSVK